MRSIWKIALGLGAVGGGLFALSRRSSAAPMQPAPTAPTVTAPPMRAVPADPSKLVVMPTGPVDDVRAPELARALVAAVQGKASGDARTVAISQFQRSAGLLASNGMPDGVFGPRTWAALAYFLRMTPAVAPDSGVAGSYEYRRS